MFLYEDNTEAENKHHMEAQGDEKMEEISVISFSDTIIHPRAVMIKHL